MNRKTFTSTELLEILRYLDEVLAREGLKLELAVYGGAAVMLYYGEQARDATEDIDAVILNRQQFGLQPQVFAEVAEKFGLDADWINSNIINTIAELKREELVRFGEFSNVVIRLPNKEQLLAMKIKAARYYPKNDFADAMKLSEDLGIRSIDELRQLVDEYIPRFLITKEVEDFMCALIGQQ